MNYKKSLSSAISACLMFAGIGVTSLSQAGFSDQGSVMAQAVNTLVANETNRIIIKYRHGAADSAATIGIMADQISQATGHAMALINTMAIGAQVFKLAESLSMEDIQSIIKKIEKDPNVKYAEPDKRYFHFYTPNDTRYNEQWHYFDDTAGIGLPEAWDITQGAGVVVAVIDTGYLEHADLADNLQLPGYDFMADTNLSNDDDGRDADASDPGDYSPECDIDQSTWHGTHTAGTVAAMTNNSAGVAGIAFNAKVLPVRILGKCGGYMSDIAAAIAAVSGTDPTPTPVPDRLQRRVDLQTRTENDSVKLSWSLVNITPRFQGIYRDTDPDPQGRGRIGVKWSETEFLDTNVTTDTTYHDWIKTRGTGGTVTNSSAVSDTIQNGTPTLTSTPYSTPDSMIASVFSRNLRFEL